MKKKHEYGYRLVVAVLFSLFSKLFIFIAAVIMIPVFVVTSAAGNTPPKPDFKVRPFSAFPGEVITADASFSKDAEDSLERLEVRWDWEDDGVWDTEYSTTKVATHTYLVPGEYRIKLGVRDSGGLQRVVVKKFLVDEPWLWSIGIIADTQAKPDQSIIWDLLQPLYELKDMKMLLHLGDAEFGYVDVVGKTKWIFDLIQMSTPPVEMLLTPGNHDNGGLMSSAWRLAAVCGRYPISSGGTIDGPIWNKEVSETRNWRLGVLPLRYHLTRGNIRFIVLDCYASEEEKAWLRDFIVQPDTSSITICIKHVNDYNYLFSCFEGLEGQHNVKLVLLGHGHLFERYYQHGVHFIQSSGQWWTRTSDEIELYDDSMRILVYSDKIHLDRIKMKTNEIVPDPWERLLTIEGNFTQHEYVPPRPCEATPPPVPQLLSPEDGFTAVSLPQLFDWTDVDDSATGGSDPCSYHIQIANNEKFSMPVIDERWLSSSQYTLTKTLPNGTYYWRVAAEDLITNHSSWSVVRYFICVDTTPPLVPQLLLPANNGEITSLPYEFRWTEVDDNSTGGRNPCKYYIEIDNDVDFSSPEVRASSLSEPRYLFTLHPFQNGTYWWRVRAEDGVGNKSDWSESRKVVFNITISPIMISLMNGDFETVLETPLTYWILNPQPDTVYSEDTTTFYRGRRSARITSTKFNDAYLWQDATQSILPQRYYKFSGWIKTENLYRAGYGSCIRIQWRRDSGGNSTLIKEDRITGPVGTTDWTKVEEVFLSPVEATTVRVMLALHFSTGTVWFDNINIEDDTTPPASIMDLDVEARFINNVPRVVLRWTAPGDDGTVGDIVSGKYRVDYAEYDKADGWDKDSYRVEFVTDVIRAGSVMSYEVEGDFMEGKRYYFCVWVMDDAGNWSGRSNIASCAVPFRAPVSNKIVVKPNIVVSSVGADDKVVLQYHVFTSGKVSIKVYSLSGELVKEFDEGHKERGVYEKIWEGLRLELRSGVYFIHYSVGEVKKTEKFIYVK